MTARELKKILSQIPDDTNICKPCDNDPTEEGCENIDDIRWFRRYNILYLSYFWPRRKVESCIRFDAHTGEMIQ